MSYPAIRSLYFDRDREDAGRRRGALFGGRGLGTACMAALRADLYGRGVRRFDTDTALGNAAAQRLYEKTGFVRAGVTRSYVRDEEG